MGATFSIIVPCYNLSQWIRDCLDSVLRQNYPAWECLVVNDASSDDSAEIVAEYARKDSRIKLITKPNGGEGSARNAGLAVATGEWVFFLDGDDVMAPGALNALAKMVQTHPAESLFRFGYAEFDDGASFPSVKHSETTSSPIDISRAIAFDDYCVYVWQFLFKRSLIEGMRFDRYKRGADRTFIVPVLCFRANAFVSTADIFYFYRKRQGSAVHSRPTVQVLKDELSHRVDVIQAIDVSGKRMPYKRTGWLEGYCLKDYLQLAEGRGSAYSTSERRELVKWFYHERNRFAKAKDYSFPGKVLAHLYGLPFGYLWRKCLMGMIELYAFVSRIRKR